MERIPPLAAGLGLRLAVREILRYMTERGRHA
jgi:hypothetical protein